MYGRAPEMTPVSYLQNQPACLSRLGIIYSGKPCADVFGLCDS